MAVGCLAAAAVAAGLAIWVQADFWRDSAANYLRERLAADLGAQFETKALRGRWFPPGLSLGRVTLQRDGEPWVLTVEDVRISFNVYAVLFGRERLGRVVLHRPRLFVRVGWGATGATGATGAAAGSAAGASNGPPQRRVAAPEPPARQAPSIAAGLRSYLRPPFPLRVLEIVDGRLDLIGASGERTLVSDIAASLLVTPGSGHLSAAVGALTVERGGRRLELGALVADVTAEEGLARIRAITAAGGPVTGTLSGTVTYTGALALKGELEADLEPLAAAAGRTGALRGSARVAGEISGSLRSPEGSGALELAEVVVAGRSWPRAGGRLAWAHKTLSWTELRMALGRGALSCSGQLDLSGDEPRYRLDATAQDLALADVPRGAGPAAAQVRGLAATLHWEGARFGRDASGAGSLSARFALAGWPGEDVALRGAAALAAGRVELRELHAAVRSLELDGVGSWSRSQGAAVRVRGAVADLGRLLAGVASGVDGAASFEGDFAADGAGPRFAGSVQLARLSVGAIGGLEVRSRVEAAPHLVRIAEAAATWRGASGRLAGEIELPSGRITLEGAVPQLPLAAAARLLGTEPAQVGGSLDARFTVRGTAAAPEVQARASAKALRYRGVFADSASLEVRWAARRLEVAELALRRGSSALTLRGVVSPNRALDGEFESQVFSLADFAPVPGVEAVGSLRGRVGGTLAEPEVKGSVLIPRLRSGGLDLRGAEFSVDYRRGLAAVSGWVLAPENRLRLALEPARDWRFDADLELRQFAPEVVRTGIAALPQGLARALAKVSFLAAGRLEASGKLRDAASVQADMRLDTLWIRASGQTLQNSAPVRFSWRGGALSIEDFRVAGEQYHFEARGGGSLSGGWALQASGAVHLALFREYWPELEEIEGTGDLQLSVGGPWSAPHPEGVLTVREARVRARSLPEPLEDLSGRLELRGRTLSASDLSGSVAGSAFRGSGSYHFGEDRLEGQVEGRLDLALFRGRLPAARELRGPVQARLRLTGPIARPALSGEVEVLDAEMFLRPFPAKITRVRGRVVIGKDRLEVRDLQGQTGGGSVRVGGTLDWSRLPLRIDAKLEGRGILVSLAGAIKAQGDLDLALQGALDDLRVSGEARVLKARYLREFGERFPSLLPEGGGAAQAAGGPQPRVALDVKVLAADNVWISNRMAKIETSVALHLGGRLDAPTVSGEIVAIQGEAIYLSRQFRLESGSLRFVPPATVPVLDVQASTTVGETQILFLMEGPLNKLAYHLTSLPGMSQEDLVALLTIGETRSNLARRGERAETAGAAVFTTEPLVNALGDEVRSAMGLEVLQLEPVVGLDNRVSAKVTLGTHLSDRLYVSYSRNLGAAEDEQIALQYSILDYLSVWGQELRQGVYSLDLVFRYSFR